MESFLQTEGDNCEVKMCKVSVIVPVYNAENFLQNTLNNIQRQSLKDIEIICVDDGSEDSSADIIKKFQRQDIRIRYEYQKNQGAGVARNKGISLAQGEYVARSLKDYLSRHTEMNSRCTRNGHCEFLTTESGSKFRESASVFLHEQIQVRSITLE